MMARINIPSYRKKFLGVCIISLLLGTASSAALAGDVYERVSQKGEIECGYGIWNPVTYKDPGNGDVKGISRDIMDAISRKIALKTLWKEEKSWGSIIEGLNNQNYDMICTPFVIMSPRTKVIDFSTPVFFLPIYIITRADDTRFDGNQPDLNSPNIQIGVLEGEVSSIISHERFPLAETVPIPPNSDYSLLLEDLKNGKSDVSFVAAETFYRFNEKEPGVLKIAGDGKPLSVLRVGFGLPQWDRSFKSLIDSAINNLQDDGALNKILDKYDPKRNLFLRLPQPYRSPP